MSKNRSDTRLVYSTDGSHIKICQKCKEQPCICVKPVEIFPEKVCIKIRLEKSGRGGKSVSVLFNMPHNPEYFAKLLKKLKSHCGAGGAQKLDTLEIQGDHRQKIKTFLEKMGFEVKLAGG